jgi:hypothetical protein
MKQTKRLPKPQQETKLERVVRYWLNSRAADYENGWKGVYRDLERGGCASGLVGKLIYYADTVKFYKRHHAEIDALLQESLASCGGSISDLFGTRWDDTDPLAHEESNQNLLAWFGFEETARKIALDNGYPE